MDESALRKEIESLLNDAENYLIHAKAKKGKSIKNFEGLLAWEYANKAKNKSNTLRKNKDYYENVNRRVAIILDELKKIPVIVESERSVEEGKYEEGDIGGG